MAPDMAILEGLSEAIAIFFGQFIKGFDEQQQREFVAALLGFMEWLDEDEDA